MLRVVLQLFIIPGFLITGGDSSGKKAELYNPASGNSCPVQDLQEDRYGHTSCGGLICGGWGQLAQSCERITGTQVSPLPSLSLTEKRTYHLCWSLPGDEGNILLLGGEGWDGPDTTTEIVTATSSSASFQLDYSIQ